MQKIGSLNLAKCFFWVLLLMGSAAAIAFFALSSQTDRPSSTLNQLDNKPLIPTFIPLSSIELASMPVIDGFESPFGTRRAGFIYDAQSFGADNAKRGGRHTGQDLNGIGGQNSDEGQLLYAAARGLVVFSGSLTPSMGNVVVIAHLLPDGKVIQSFYGHLDKRYVHRGEHVARGSLLGSIGTAGGRYWAHLHFAMIDSIFNAAGARGYEAKATSYYRDPEELIARYPAPSFPDAYLQLRQIRQREAMTQNVNTHAKLPKGVTPINPSQFIPST